MAKDLTKEIINLKIQWFWPSSHTPLALEPRHGARAWRLHSTCFGGRWRLSVHTLLGTSIASGVMRSTRADCRNRWNIYFRDLCFFYL